MSPSQQAWPISPQQIDPRQIVPRQTAPWQILGAGSIGCLFAAYLQRAGIDLQLILRDAASLALWQRAAAITLQRAAVDEHITEEHLAPADGATEHIAVRAISAAQLRGPVTKILVCTKAQQTLAAIAAIRAVIDPNAVLILLQNGMGVREQLADLLPQATILHALTTEGAYQPSRFHIVHAGRGATVLGALQPHQQRLARAASAELHCELTLDAVDNIGAQLWQKLAVNSVINPLTALYECRNGELLQLSNIDATIDTLCAEACAVANAEGQPLDVRQLIDTVHTVCRITAANRSSMLQDLTQRRRTEIDFINGYILQRAAQHRIGCPQQQAVFTALKERERALGCA